MIAIRHAESLFIKEYKQHLQIFKENETRMNDFDRELYYNDFAV